MPAANTEERLWQFVTKDRGCWLWSGPRHWQPNFDYGFIRFRGRFWLAHRLIWTLLKGPIGKGLCVLHHCDNPPCVNPSHLFLGTRGDNNRDALKKGRQVPGRALGDLNGSRKHPERLLRGQQNPSARLSEEKVRVIRRRYAEGQTSLSILG